MLSVNARDELVAGKERSFFVVVVLFFKNIFKMENIATCLFTDGNNARQKLKLMMYGRGYNHISETLE